MKKLLFIAALFISNFCFSQAENHLSKDTSTGMPIITYDTLQTIQADSPIVVTKVSPYKIKFGLTPGYTGGQWTKSTLYPSEIFVGASPNTINHVSIGIDDSIAPLHISRAIAISSIDTGLVISNPTVATASNSTYSPAVIESAVGNNGGTAKDASIRHYIGTSATGTYQDPSYYWDMRDPFVGWKNVMKLQAFGFGGGSPYGGLTVGGININTTGNQIDIGSNSNVFTLGSAGNFGGIKLLGNGSSVNMYSNYNTYFLGKNLSINDSATTRIADSSALVDVYSYIHKGFLIPRLTTSQRDSLISAIYKYNSVSITNGGSGYVNGTYNSVHMTGGSGSGAILTLSVSGGAVTASLNFTYFRGGTGYKVGDILSANNTDLGGTGSGLQITVNQVGAYAVNAKPNGLLVYNTTMNRINTWDGTQWNYSPQVTYGTAAPTSTPVAIGDEFVDTTNKKIYFATGTSASTDWTITN